MSGRSVTGLTQWMPLTSLLASYGSWVIHRESWLPVFPLARHYRQDREGSGRLEE